MLLPKFAHSDRRKRAALDAGRLITAAWLVSLGPASARAAEWRLTDRTRVRLRTDMYVSEQRFLEHVGDQVLAWETEWSFHHMFRLLRRITLRKTITSRSTTKHDLQHLIHHLENYLYLAA